MMSRRAKVVAILVTFRDWSLRFDVTFFKKKKMKNSVKRCRVQGYGVIPKTERTLQQSTTLGSCNSNQPGLFLSLSPYSYIYKISVFYLFCLG